MCYLIHQLAHEEIPTPSTARPSLSYLSTDASDRLACQCESIDLSTEFVSQLKHKVSA